jgi:hypothetical protein
MHHNGRTRKVMTVEWEKVNGPVPKGKVLDHLCKMKACIEVLHLEPVTQKVNVHRGRAMELRKLACDKCGGPYSVVGTKPNGRPERRCRPCCNDRLRRWRHDQSNVSVSSL